jgi:hypothetical protein
MAQHFFARLAVRSAAAQRNGCSRRRTGLGSEAILATVPGWSQTSDTAGAQRIGHTCRQTSRDGACTCQPVAALREGLHLIDTRCSAAYWSRLCRQVHVISPVDDALGITLAQSASALTDIWNADACTTDERHAGTDTAFAWATTIGLDYPIVSTVPLRSEC